LHSGVSVLSSFSGKKHKQKEHLEKDKLVAYKLPYMRKTAKYSFKKHPKEQGGYSLLQNSVIKMRIRSVEDQLFSFFLKTFMVL